MKKLFMLLALAAGTVTFAQENTAIDTMRIQNNEERIKWYFGFGAVANPDFNINSNLKDAGVHRIADVIPGVVFGWEGTIKRISIDTEFAIAGIYDDFRDDGYRLVQGSVGLKVQYALIDKPKSALFSGISLPYVTNNLSVFERNTTIDINNLTPSENSGFLMLYNHSFYIGPVVSVQLFRQSRTPLYIKAGYDVNLANNRWKSAYANVSNTVRENGNRAYLYLTIPFESIFN